MTLHQVNGDGAGPYTCQIDAAGDGSAFVDMKVTTNVAGKNSRSNAKAVDLPLKAAIPAGQTCGGSVAGQNNVCMVRCMNAARAGPFGGCVPVQMVAAAGNSAAGGNSAPAANAAPADNTGDSAPAANAAPASNSADSGNSTNKAKRVSFYSSDD